MEEDPGNVQSRTDEIENESQQQQRKESERDQNILEFLDSMDNYLTLIDTLSSALRQGWLEIASARHSMGASRINSALFDLSLRPAATSLKVMMPDGKHCAQEPQFTLCKWTLPHSFDDEKVCSKSLPLGHKESLEKIPVDDQIQKARAKSLSVFGTLVSPKLRAAQLSFETALDAVVEIANTRSSMLCAFDKVREDQEVRI